eukprot:1137948-Pelagomonas_calceolata.AAC.3
MRQRTSEFWTSSSVKPVSLSSLPALVSRPCTEIWAAVCCRTQPVGTPLASVGIVQDGLLQYLASDTGKRRFSLRPWPPIRRSSAQQTAAATVGATEQAPAGVVLAGAATPARTARIKDTVEGKELGAFSVKARIKMMPNSLAQPQCLSASAGRASMGSRLTFMCAKVV